VKAIDGPASAEYRQPQCQAKSLFFPDPAIIL